MTRTRSWILTDVAAETCLEAFRITSQDFPQVFPAGWSLEKRRLKGGRRDGVELIEVDNGALSFSLLPTRGMGLWRGQYRGLHIGWRAPVQGPVHPAHVNLLDRGGLGWLDGFDEAVCRCGLASNGPPGKDDRTGEFLTLHGRVANLPAHYVEVKVNLDPPHELMVIGQVDEATLFFQNLRLTSLFLTTPGSNRLVIQDVVENLSSRPAELELLYHCNFGPPFLGGGSRVVCPIREAMPRDPRAAEGIERLEVCDPPTAGYAEQVYFYDPLADASGKTLALLHNASADKGLVVRFARAELPCFTLWKNTAAAEDGYVVGLEPGTNYPNFKGQERERGRVRTLSPGGSYRAELAIELFDSATGVAKIRQEIANLQNRAVPVIHKTPRVGYP